MIEQEISRETTESSKIIDETIDRYGLESRAFLTSQDVTVSLANEILNNYDLESSIVDLNPEFYIDFLSIIDGSSAYSRLRELLLFELGVENMSHFPPYPDPFPQKIDNFRERFLSPDKTEYVRERINDTSENSFLRPVREKLSLLKDREFDVEVFDVNTRDFCKQFKLSAFVLKSQDGFTIYLPYDASDATISHEWIHTQLPHLRQGADGLFFAGLDEAVVEDCSLDPSHYTSQREVFNELVNVLGTSFKETVIQTAGGDKQAAFEMRRRIIKKFGLPGLLSIMRMTRNDSILNDPYIRDENKRVVDYTWKVKRDLSDSLIRQVIQLPHEFSI